MGHLERKLTTLFVDADARPLLELALENLGGQRILEPLLNHAF